MTRDEYNSRLDSLVSEYEMGLLHPADYERGIEKLWVDYQAAGGGCDTDDSCAPDEHDDAKDHDPCPDCGTTGWYVGFTTRQRCRTCDGSGWL